MSYEERIREAYPGMSKSFVKLADFILDSYIETSFMTATELAHAVDVDTTTVVRFSQHLGYRGYPDLLREIRSKVKSQILVQSQKADEADSFAGQVKVAMERLTHALDQSHMLLDVETMENMADEIGKARRIIILTDPLGQTAGTMFGNLLEMGGFQTYHSLNNVVDLARTVRKGVSGDFFLAIDVGGDTPYLARALNEVSSQGIVTGAIVGAASLETARAADLVLAAQVQPSMEFEIMLVIAIVFALGQIMRWRFTDRFKGADEEISKLADQIQHYEEKF